MGYQQIQHTFWQLYLQIQYHPFFIRFKPIDFDKNFIFFEYTFPGSNNLAINYQKWEEHAIIARTPIVIEFWIERGTTIFVSK